MKVTAHELHSLLSNNPDLALVTDGRRTDIVPKAQVGGLSEYDMQRQVFEACALRAVEQPAYALLMAVPNGQYRKGQRPEPGIKPGACDLLLPIARGPYHGLWIELKVRPNKPTAAQVEFMRRMEEQGYAVAVIWDSVDEVMRAIDTYLGDA